MRIGEETKAVITGASRGIGRALSFELASRGATLGLCARDKGRLSRLAEELPGHHHVLAVDVTDRKDTQRAVGEFAERAGGLDLLIANAGIAHYGPFAEMDPAKTEEMVEINLLGSLHTVRAGLDRMLPAAPSGGGHIVIVSSGAGIRAFPSGAVYGATKAANRAFAEALRHELAGTGISLTTVFPGEVATDLHNHQPDRMPDWRKSDEAIDPADLAGQIADAIEADERNIYAPSAVRMLGLNGISPGLVDRLLRRVRGEAAAPRH